MERRSTPRTRRCRAVGDRAGAAQHRMAATRIARRGRIRRRHPELRVPGYRGVFAIGDVAATDPLRSSARNRADGVLAHNILAEPEGRPLRSYRPPRSRWGSVIGVQDDGMEVFSPGGRPFRIPAWPVRRVLMPLIVRRGIYRGMRSNQPLG